MGKEKGKEILHSAPVDALFLTNAANMRFVAGFTGEGYVYISDNISMVVTDSRYTIAAKEECPGFYVAEWDKIGYYTPLFEMLQKDRVVTLGIEDKEMTVSDYQNLIKRLNEAKLSEIKIEMLADKVTEHRAIKSEEEIAAIRQAEKIGDQAYKRVLSELKTGITEKQVAALIEFFMKEEGAEGISFDTIAASGIHSAMPHAVPTDKVLERGDFLTMDFGCRYRGYCSDMTRTVVIGEASDRQKKIYETVLTAQKTALAGIRPGLTGKEVDALARDVIEKAGFGENFGHSLGHSVGLDIHEKPGFTTKEKGMICPGMVITVEPGIYIENYGGVRIEDVVVITEEGCENITHSPKNLIEINK
ncbi:MAG: aminopeptidase P family protein [Lachnospiraceae bacterium]|nr:aminopeptidase P family protein [Lachnospiraceae bacterium]